MVLHILYVINNEQCIKFICPSDVQLFLLEVVEKRSNFTQTKRHKSMDNSIRRLGSFFSILFITCLLSQSIWAKNDKKEIPLHGEWKEGIRSVSSTIPVSVFINEGILSLHSSTQRSDITICISKEGEKVYEKTVSASMTDCVIIDLTGFGEGDYTVELRNQWGDYLWGELGK